MASDLILTKQAAKDLEGLPEDVARRLVQKLLWFSRQGNPTKFGKRLREPAAGDLRFRIGDYRAIAIIEEKTQRIVIVKIGHRRGIY